MIDIRNFGAKGDGVSDDTKAIAAAIAAAHNGGDTVIVTAGNYRTGPIRLTDNIELRVEAGAALIFIPEFCRYPPVRTRWEGVECWAFHPLVFADGAEKIAIRGAGRLDGSGSAWWDYYRAARRVGRKRPESEEELNLAGLNPDYLNQPSGGGGRELQFLRPPLVQFVNCRNILIEGLHLVNSPFWNTHLVFCQDAVVRGVTFVNPADAPNTDGLDLDSSSDVLIENCEFDVGDDCLGLKSGSGEDGIRIGRPTERISIRDCLMHAGHGGVVVGSETAGGVRDVAISGCDFRATDRGLRIKTRRGRGGTVENISIKNTRMTDVLCPVVVNCYYGPGGPSADSPIFSLEAQPITAMTPRVRNIHVEDLVATGCRATAGFAVGLPESPIEDLTVTNSRFVLAVPVAADIDCAAMTRGLPKAAGRGFRLRNVNGVAIQNVVVEPATEAPLLVEEAVQFR